VEAVAVKKEGFTGYSRRIDDPTDVHLQINRVHYLEGWVRSADSGEPVQITDVSICEVIRREIDGTIEYAG
jgi:hypothetical protein